MKNLFITILLFLNLPQAMASLDSTGELGTRWNKKELKVCWINSKKEYRVLPEEVYRKTGSFKNISALTQDEKTAIQDTVTTEFTAEKTGIQFNGWSNCVDAPKADIYLITSTREHSFYGFSPIGGPEGPSLLFISRIIANKLTALDTLRMFALHEFGHAAGLRHEHLRDESKNDFQCKISDARTGEHADSKTIFLTEYDPSSIMNYCHIHLLHKNTGLHYQTTIRGLWLSDETITTVERSARGWLVTTRIGLSAGDQLGLKRLYP